MIKVVEMGDFFKAIKAGVAGFKSGMGGGPGEYKVIGRTVKCPHCGHQKFISGEALLNTRGKTFLSLDWLDPSVTVLLCAQCGRMEWFAQAEPADD